MTDAEHAWKRRFERAHAFLARCKKHTGAHWSRACRYIWIVNKRRPDALVGPGEIRRAQG